MKGRNRHASWTAERQRDFRSRWRLFAAILTRRAVVVVEGATVRPLSHGVHRHDHLRTTPRHRRHRLYLLAAVHPRCLCAAVFRRSDDRHLGLSHRRRRARRHRRGSCGRRRNLWPWPARARLCAMGMGSAPDHPALSSRPPPSPATAPRMESPRWRCLHPPGRRSSPSSARSPSASRRSSASPEWPRPDQPDRAWRGADIITSTAVGAGPDHAFRMLAILVVERGVRADWRRSSPDHRRVPGVVAGC